MPSITDVPLCYTIILMGLKTCSICDIDHVGFNINIEQIKKITSKTKAVIVAHIGGEVANIIKIKNFLRRKNLLN